MLPPLRNARSPEFAAFFALCHALTGLADIEREFCRRVYETLLGEPWGAQHMAQVYLRARSLARSGKAVIEAANYSDAEQWFISHILVTLYTGVYYHASGHRALGYEEALMFRVLQGRRATPTVCGGEYGTWSRPPAVGAHG